MFIHSSVFLKPGTIGCKELHAALTTIGDKLTHEECCFILQQVTDKQLEVNIEKLVLLVAGDSECDDEAENIGLGVVKSIPIVTAHIREQDLDCGASIVLLS